MVRVVTTRGTMVGLVRVVTTRGTVVLARGAGSGSALIDVSVDGRILER